ncbi:MAG: endonuclease/exonuclease/phosphatase family protein [Bacteroidales bacterium]|nr:endonuclease/exonuclease/phosphatase family protein [Bacteroidales bacterium]
MKKFIGILLFMAFAYQSGYNQDTIQLRILTYNIYHGATMKGDFNLDTIANRIAFHQPDLVALQEVDRLTMRAKKMDLVTELGYRSKMAPLFGRAMYYDTGEYGEGILSKYSFIKTASRPLPALPDHEPRVALEVLICLPSGDTIAFVGTHLEHNHNAPDRVSQAKKLAELYRDFPYPVILAGDLNDTPESEAMSILFESFTPSYGEKALPTFPSDQPKKKIDYILTDKNHQWRVIETQVIRDEVVSDHCGYLSVIELIKN